MYIDYVKYIPEHERAALPSSDFGGPGRSFPIRNEMDVMHASHLVGHAADPNAVRDKIISIAKRKGLPLPEAWQHLGGGGDKDGDMDSGKSFDTLVCQGGEVKNLGGGKIGGHIVLFTTKHDPDTSGDYFDSDTDFDIEDNDRMSGYYRHGFDLKIGMRKIGSGNVVKDSKGLWLEAQLNQREEYLDEIMDMIDSKKLGYSTGALSHLVAREAKNKAATLNYITNWPLKEWSLLPDPCEPRTLAIPLKMWAKNLSLEPRAQEDTNEPAAEIKAAVSITTIRELEAFLRDAGASVKEAKTVVSRFALRDVVAEPITPEVEKPQLIDAATKQSAELRFRQRSYKLEGLLLAMQ